MRELEHNCLPNGPLGYMGQDMLTWLYIFELLLLLMSLLLLHCLPSSLCLIHGSQCNIATSSNFEWMLLLSSPLPTSAGRQWNGNINLAIYFIFMWKHMTLELSRILSVIVSYTLQLILVIINSFCSSVFV